MRSVLRRAAACLLAACALSGAALGGEEAPIVADGASRKIEVPIEIKIGNLGTLRVSPRGFVPPDNGNNDGNGEVNPQRCNVISSHTDANFGGGSFVVQAGFAQQEMFAATYNLTAADFPIRHQLTEVIVATSNSTVQTTTQWSLLFYAGTPTNGTLIDVFSSDDVLLPHIRIPAGTNGVNLQFSIDPNDPDQLIIPSNPTNQFTVAFRIDRHNNQVANPCMTAPPAASNAFPATDVSGLSQAGLNWLFGVNCGPIGCPNNGGWSTFANLLSFCRPSGDWVSRTTWSSVNCTPGVGACCLPNGSCIQTSSAECQTQNGTFRGDGTDCATANCPQPTGACCFPNGFCVPNLTATQCSGAGGTFAGANTACGPNSTCPTGACCLPNGSCVSVTSAQCAAQSGTFRGVGVACAGANCPQPTGACCFANGFCLSLTEAACQGAGGTWKGALTTCADGNNNGQADICELACRPDFNRDGTLDFFDYLDFVGAFSIEDPSADYNVDSVVDFFDYLDFAADFEAGC
jgi:hypothetical protein